LERIERDKKSAAEEDKTNAAADDADSQDLFGDKDNEDVIF